jgi:hypothetical protein
MRHRQELQQQLHFSLTCQQETLKMQFPNETSSPSTQPSVSKTQPQSVSHPQPPVMSRLTQAEKNKVKNKLKSEFPGVTEIELNTAVQVTDYNESMARDLLKSMSNGKL